MKGQPDIIIGNCHLIYRGLCIEFKSPTNNYQVSKAKKEMKKLYRSNGYRLIISNDYDRIIRIINEHMIDIRLPCKYCCRKLKNENTLIITKNTFIGLYKYIIYVKRTIITIFKKISL